MTYVRTTNIYRDFRLNRLESISLASLTRQQSIPIAISNYAPPSLWVIRVFKGQRANVTYVHTIIGERAKRARHSQVCSIENRGYIYQLEKWFPLWGERAHSLKLFCMYDKRFEI